MINILESLEKWFSSPLGKISTYPNPIYKGSEKMAKKQNMDVKLNSINTFTDIFQRMVNIANSVFLFDNAPKSIDPLWVNNKLLRNGSIAFFEDDVMKELYALPYECVGVRDLYGKPIRIRCIGQNGYHSKVLSPEEYVIMYDNTSLMPLLLSIRQLAMRIAKCDRTIDINISQQKTPRILKSTNNNILTIKSFLDRIENYEEAIVTFQDLALDDLEFVLAPAPFVSDKVAETKEKLWKEFYNLVGVSNVDIEKKERLISDEVINSMGGNMIGRYSRFIPRQNAVDEINSKFNKNISVICYDEVIMKQIKGGDINAIS